MNFEPVADYRRAFAHPDFLLEPDVEQWLVLSGASFADVRGAAPEFWWEGHPSLYLSVTVHARSQLHSEFVARRYRIVFMEVGSGRQVVDLSTDSISICHAAQMLYTENIPCSDSESETPTSPSFSSSD